MSICDIHIHDGQISLSGAQVGVLVALAVAFGAFCVWLVVRLANGRKHTWRVSGVALIVVGAALMLSGLCYFGVIIAERWDGRSFGDIYRTVAFALALVLGLTFAAFGDWLRKP